MTDEQLKSLALAALVQQAVDRYNESIKDAEPDQRFCCDGEMCGCGGMSNRDHWMILADIDEGAGYDTKT